MSEEDFIEELRRRWPREASQDVVLETLALADEATRAFPRSAPLWVMLGDLIQLGPKSTPHPLLEALASYQRAIEIDPKFASAWEEMAHFHSGVLDDEATAQKYFLEAKRLRRFGSN